MVHLPSPELSTHASQTPALLPCECLQRGRCVRRLVFHLSRTRLSRDPSRCLLGPRFLHSESQYPSDTSVSPHVSWSPIITEPRWAVFGRLGPADSKQPAAADESRPALHAQPPQRTRPAPAFKGNPPPPRARVQAVRQPLLVVYGAGLGGRGRPTCAHFASPSRTRLGYGARDERRIDRRRRRRRFLSEAHVGRLRPASTAIGRRRRPCRRRRRLGRRRLG